MSAAVEFNIELYGRGYKHILDYLDKTKNIINSGIYDSLIDASMILRDKAIQNVKTWNQSAWLHEPGMSQDGQSIVAESNWIHNKIDDNTLELTCLSNHAAVVELGGLTPQKTITALVRAKRGYGYPIGAQQGHVPLVRKSFVIQQPMAYLGRARDSQEIQDYMKYRIRQTLWNYIKSNLGD